jgi:hypothetical protein
MECIGLLIIIGVGFAIYQAIYMAGKRDGSRKGYGVGFDRGRKSGKGGCLFFMTLLIAAVFVALRAVTANWPPQ